MADEFVATSNDALLPTATMTIEEATERGRRMGLLDLSVTIVDWVSIVRRSCPVVRAAAF
jgi:hypothetical protein